MPQSRNTNYGGNRAGRRHLPIFKNRPSSEAPSKPAPQLRDEPREGYDLCAVCGLYVKLRTDGTIRSHRTGSKRQGTWPCPGADTSISHVTGRNKNRMPAVATDEMIEKPDMTWAEYTASQKKRGI